MRRGASRVLPAPAGPTIDVDAGAGGGQASYQLRLLAGEPVPGERGVDGCVVGNAYVCGALFLDEQPRAVASAASMPVVEYARCPGAAAISSGTVSGCRIT